MFIYYPKALNILNLNNNSDTDNIKNYIIKFNKYIEVLGAFLIVVGSIAIVPFTNIIMTKYVQSIGIYRILSMSVIAVEELGDGWIAVGAVVGLGLVGAAVYLGIAT